MLLLLEDAGLRLLVTKVVGGVDVDKDAADEEDDDDIMDEDGEVLVPMGSALEAYEVVIVDVGGFVLLREDEEELLLLLWGVVYVGSGG